MPSLNKVPAVTAVFWIIKILTTGMGEALADYFDHEFDPILVVAISGLVLALALWLQFKAPKFVAWRYWFTVSMVSVFGTLAADAVHVILGVPYWFSTGLFLLGLTVLFAIWHATEKTISISRIDTNRREIFYWFVVMASVANRQRRRVLGNIAGIDCADCCNRRIHCFQPRQSKKLKVLAVGCRPTPTKS